ncbi:mRNA 3'-end-processing protein rna14 [Stygiomarasmius scandens]|uniref:mRNA 3'-end-processing protein RNA14 n=1 Tax=Marasmiellus scandens TaxID=2682957 RepID=A0ABR1J1P3_9AGAR
MKVQVKDDKDDVANQGGNDDYALVSTSFDSLSDYLQENPADEDAWRKFLARAEDSGEAEKISAACELFLKHYPNTPFAQIAYIGFFLNSPKTFSKAEDLFRRFLKVSPSVELLSFYLTYIRRVLSNKFTLNIANFTLCRRIDTNSSTRDTVRQAYEFALDLVGQDRHSGDIWSDYISFLDATPASSTWEVQHKTDTIRRAYSRATQIPLDNVETLWNDYEHFERKVSPGTAAKFISDLSPAYNRATAALCELNRQTSHLFQPALSAKSHLFPPALPVRLVPILPRFILSERQHVGRWKAYLKWEESNPLMMDNLQLQSRISLVYQKALVVMRFFPEIWFMAYTWMNLTGKQEKALATLKSGIEANPASFLLNFAYIDFLENKKEFETVHKTFNRLLEILQKNLDRLQAEAVALPDDVHESHGTEAGSSSEELQARLFRMNIIDSEELKDMVKEYGLVWIMYMRFGRRAEGVQSSRAIFGKARKGKYVSWEIFEAAALMEFHCSADTTVAARIFELGMNTHSREEDFVLRYLSFLISQNDRSNARTLFERIVSTPPFEQSRSIWGYWSRYVYQYGTLDTARDLEKRMMEVFPHDPPIKRFAQRYTYLATDAIASRDVGAAMSKKESQIARQKEREKESLGASVNGDRALDVSKRQAVDKLASKTASSPLVTELGSGKRRGRDGDHGAGNKRQRTSSPAGRNSGRSTEGGFGMDRGRGERWKGFSSLEVKNKDRCQETIGNGKKTPQFPSTLSRFIGQLPAPSTFDGPVFNPDDMMKLLRTVVIPSTSRAKSPLPHGKSRLLNNLGSIP